MIINSIADENCYRYDVAMMDRQKHTEPAAATSGAPSAEKPLSTEQLFGAGKVVLIEHRGERYQLRLTQNGKLILTK